MTYTAVIVEDNPVDAEVLSDYLQKYFPEIVIAASAGSVAEVKKLLAAHTPEIVFMDIELADGKSIEVLDSLCTESMQLIFITSYHAFAIDALRANAVDYIVKPVDGVLLKKAVLKAFKRIELSRVAKALISGLGKKISVPTADGYTFIDIEKIVRVEANGNYATVIMDKAKPLLVSRTLLHFEKELPAKQFMRIHDSFLVNREFIAGYIKGKTPKIRMTDGFVCSISEGKKGSFLRWVQGG